MDDLTESIVARETALANFDHARDDFETAFARVPDEALEWKPEGDDYTLGYLVPHVLSSIATYSTVLDRMAAAGYGPVPPGWEADEAMKDYNAEMMAIYAAGAGRAPIIDELDAAHDRLASRLRELAYEDYSRPSPVHYPGGAEPFPTRAQDILAWLTDHYTEHIVQIDQMLKEWEKSK
ncbi:MAG: DinB family protein [Chloroflexota bacterium]